MSNREGNLEAPTRHPLDWISDDFYNEDSLNKELERVFDICHGCRRCVSLCGSFPTLFDLVDESPTLEVDGVDKKDYWKVVDQCYLCDVCYMTKCPYTPPHPWNLDFPHLMLRAKAVKFKKGEVHFRDKFLSNTDGFGSVRRHSDRDANRECGEQDESSAEHDGESDRRRQGCMAAGIRR